MINVQTNPQKIVQRMIIGQIGIQIKLFRSEAFLDEGRDFLMYLIQQDLKIRLILLKIGILFVASSY